MKIKKRWHLLSHKDISLLFSKDCIIIEMDYFVESSASEENYLLNPMHLIVYLSCLSDRLNIWFFCLTKPAVVLSANCVPELLYLSLSFKLKLLDVCSFPL